MSNIDKKKEAILLEAWRLISEEGSFSLEALSQTSGVSRVTLYRYFGGRDRLIEEVEKRFNIDGTEFKRDILEKRILEAAGRLFFSKGLFQVTLEEIADEAQVGIATLYRKFDSRDRLIEEFLGSQFVENANFNINGNAHPEIELRRAACEMLKVLEKSAGFLKIAIADLDINSEFFKKIKKGQYRTLHQLSDYFEVCIQRGEMKQESPLDLAAGFLGLVLSFSFFMPQFYGYVKEDNEKTADFIVSIFLKGVQK